MSRTKLLIALDPVQPDTDVVKQGILLATGLNLEVVLMAVINREPDLTEMATGFVQEQLRENEFREAEEILREIKSLNSKVTEVIVKYGNPREDLLKAVYSKEFAYLVMGTHGRSAISQFVLGGTAEYVVRHSSIPVLVVPYNEQVH